MDIFVFNDDAQKKVQVKSECGTPHLLYNCYHAIVEVRMSSWKYTCTIRRRLFNNTTLKITYTNLGKVFAHNSSMITKHKHVEDMHSARSLQAPPWTCRMHNADHHCVQRQVVEIQTPSNHYQITRSNLVEPIRNKSDLLSLASQWK